MTDEPQTFQEAAIAAGRRARREQGRPEHLEDPIIIDRLARLLARPRYDQPTGLIEQTGGAVENPIGESP